MRTLLKLFLLFFVISTLTPAFLMWRVVRYSEQDFTQPADAAIVLGAGVFRGRPSPVLRARIDHAIGLYNSGTVDKIIFTGGIGRNDSLSEAEVSANYAIAKTTTIVRPNSTNVPSVCARTGNLCATISPEFI